MTLSFLPNFWKGRSRVVSGIFRAFTLSLLVAAFGLNAAYGQMVAYVTNHAANTVSVIDVASNTVTATIPVGNFPVGVVVAPNGDLAYVANFQDGTISVIDTHSNTVTNTISLGAGATPALPAITPDGQRLYVPEQDKGVVAVVSTVSNSVVATIPDVGPEAAAITPDGSLVYVQDAEDSILGLHVIATATNTVIADLRIASLLSFGIAGAPNGQSIYATDGIDPNVSVISTSTNTVTATIADPGEPEGIAISLDGGTAYVSNLGSTLANANQVNVINLSTNTVVASIPVGNGPESLAVTPDDAFVYVKNAGDGTVSAIDASTNTVIATVQTEPAPPPNRGIPLIPPAGSIATANLTTPFAAFTIDNLNISPQGFHEQGDFTLGANSSGVDLAHQPFTATIGSFSFTIPPGSFRQVGGNLHFVLNASINGLQINCNLSANHGSSTAFSYVLNVNGVDLTAQPDPVTVGLKIGENTGTTTVQF